MSAPETMNPLDRRPLHRLGQRLFLSIERHETRYLLLALAIFTLAAVYRDLTTPIWFDEFFTLFLSQLSSVHATMQAMPADGQPPLQYLPTHLSLHIFGASEIALRLPELMACIGAGWLAYKIARRRGSAVQALFAIVLIFGAQQWQQALSARPYGMLLAFTALLFFAWQRATEGGRRGLALCLMALAIAGAILSHHFGAIYAAILLGAGEATRLIQRRRIDGWMLLAIACGLVPLAITAPLAHASSALLGNAVHLSTTFWAKPRLAEIFRYSRSVAWPMLVAVGLFAALLWRNRPAVQDAPEDSVEVPAHEWAAAGALSLILPFQMLFAEFVTGYFQPRYVIGTSLGLALLFAWGLPRIRLLQPVWKPAFALATLGFLAASLGKLAIEEIRHPAAPSTLAAETVPAMLNDGGSLPIVVASAYEYAPLWWYSPPAIRARLVYLSDVPYAIQQQDFLPELSLATGQDFIPLHVTSYAGFLQDHPRFLLYLTGERRLEWIAPRLASQGWQSKLLTSSGPRQLFQVDKTNPH
jgi:hypothetical protein